jgi:hypothetical protein
MITNRNDSGQLRRYHNTPFRLHSTQQVPMFLLSSTYGGMVQSLPSTIDKIGFMLNSLSLGLGLVMYYGLVSLSISGHSLV